MLLAVAAFVAAKLPIKTTIRRIPVLLPALGTFILCLLISHTVVKTMPFVPGDEDEYIFQAKIFARGALTAPAPEPAHPFWAPGILVHEDRWMGHHQPGHSLFLSLGLILGSANLIPALMTGLTVLLLTLSGRALGGKETGYLTGILGMTSPMLLMTGATLVSETTSLLLVALGFWLIIRQPGRMKNSILCAGFILGVLFNVRLLTAMCTIAALVCVMPIRNLRYLLPGLLAGMLFAAVHNTFVTGSPWIFPFNMYEVDAIGFKEKFRPIEAFGHSIRNIFLLNLWLLGWPISFLLLKPGLSTMPSRLKRSVGVFFITLLLVYAFYWHPGQIATGPLRLYEVSFPLLVICGLGWAASQKKGSFLSKLVPLLIFTSVLGFLPVRMAVLHTFIQTEQAVRFSLDKINLENRLVVLKGSGNLFHYPRNDPWLRPFVHPLMIRAQTREECRRIFPYRDPLVAEAQCDTSGCDFRYYSWIRNSSRGISAKKSRDSVRPGLKSRLSADPGPSTHPPFGD